MSIKRGEVELRKKKIEKSRNGEVKKWRMGETQKRGKRNEAIQFPAKEKKKKKKKMQKIPLRLI